ncbi:MAG: 50S ribosomal protein L31 [Candidatus Berkelbacteria bacterium]|nr:50S ribosomal protein L31 [Candidatus Berkelbacteria bacterium]
MKQNIHPKYYNNAKVKCSCGAEFEIGSTNDNIQVEICSNCHPLYTGNKKLVDTAGRVDRFMARLKKSESLKQDVKLQQESQKKSKDEAKTDQDTKK